MRLGAIMLAAAFMSPLAVGQEWTRFRGPNGQGVGRADSIPVKWTPEDYDWKVKLPGTGHGSPVVWGDRVFLLCCDEKDARRIVACQSTANGGTVWSREYPSKPYKQNSLNSYAGSTPAVDKDRVYCWWATPEKITVTALDHAGKDVWQRDLGGFDSEHGPCLSPIVHQDVVIVPNDQRGKSFLTGLDAATGSTRWQTPRKEGRDAYMTPCLHAPPGRPPELIFTRDVEGMTAIDPKTGKVNWELGGLFPQRCVGSPAIANGLIVASCGTGGAGVRTVAVRPPQGGKSAELAWEFTKNCPYVPTPLAKGDLIFTAGDRGVFSCLKAATGQVLWQERVGGGFYGSPILVGDRIYCISQKGDVVVLAASEKYQLLGTNSLGEKCFTTPAIAGSRMFIRTYEHLISLGGKRDRP